LSGFDLSNFLASFFDEARERLASIDQSLVDFEAGTLDDEGLVSLRRDAHTIKGSALMLGVNDIGGVAHLFEDAMEQLIQHPEWRTPAMTQFLYDLHDQLSERLADPDADLELEPKPLRARFDELTRELQESGGGTPAPETKPAQPMIGAEEKSEALAREKAAMEAEASGAVEKAEPEQAPDTTEPEASVAEASIPEIELPEQSESVEASEAVARAADESSEALEIAGDEGEEDFFELGEGFTLDTEALLGDFDAGDTENAEPGIREEVEFAEAVEEEPLAELDLAGLDLGEQLSATTPESTEEPGQAAGGMIGAEDATAWKEERKADVTAAGEEAIAMVDLDETRHEAEVAGQLEAAALETAGEEEEAKPEGRLPLPEKSLEDIDDFRPDVSQIELKKTGQRRSSGRFLRVDAVRLEELSNHVIELSTEKARGESFEEAFNALFSELRVMRREWRALHRSIDELSTEQREKSMQALDRAFESQVRKTRRFIEELRYSQVRSDVMLRDLRDQVLGLMLRPLDSIFSTFPRAVRDIAVRVDKRVRLVVGGKAVEVDQGVAESLVEPMVHLLNNAVAHGIESAEERRAAGKPEDGQISIIARQSGNEVRIEVVDDGRGLDVETIKRVAVERGVTTQLEADEMDSAEILEMIFRPGFSTHANVSDIAGRGIGMNVVQDAVRRLTGSIRIHSEKGKGTRFILVLPTSIAVQHALLFRMGDQNFGMLTHMVEQAIPLRKQQVEKGHGGKDFIRYGHHQVPVVDLRRVMNPNASDIGQEEEPYVIIAEHIEGYVGIVVDELLDDTEIVVRDLDPYIKRYQPQGLMGNTITADGSILMLLEPYGIKEMGRTAPDQAFVINVSEEERMAFTILLVEDSLIAREVEKGIFESIGFTVHTAIDGMDALEKMDGRDYDMIVTDLEMPRLDGFGLVRRIRNKSEYEDLPIMVISTRESAEDRMRALESGADAYMVKQQLDGEEIKRTVRALVGH
jgi:chemotaxis protein histidine kinase CheA